jgi:preprotein translocase subunit SecB
MSDQAPSGQDSTPVFNIEKIYIKDLSIEVPNAPHCFLERESAEINLQMHSSGEAIGDDVFHVVLTLTVTAKIGEKTQFLIEVAQSGIFTLRNVPTTEVEPIIAVACPNILFPFARETVSDAVTRAGFPPVLLAPVNFEAIYRERQMQQPAGSQDTPIQ